MNISDFMQLTAKHPEIPDHNKEDWNKEPRSLGHQRNAELKDLGEVLL